MSNFAKVVTFVILFVQLMFFKKSDKINKKGYFISNTINHDKFIKYLFIKSITETVPKRISKENINAFEFGYKQGTEVKKSII